jgi:hypothetical protein
MTCRLPRVQKASEAQAPPEDETNKLVYQEPDPLTLLLRDAQLLVTPNAFFRPILAMTFKIPQVSP